MKKNLKRKYERQLKRQDILHKKEMKEAQKKIRQHATSHKVVTAMKDKIKRIKNPQERKRLTDTIVSPSKKGSGIASAIGRMANIDRRTVFHKKTGHLKRKARLGKKTWRVMQFLQDPQWSWTSPSKKDMVSVRYTMTVDGKMVVWRRRVARVTLTRNIGEIHKLYNEKNPDLQVDIKLFKQIRRRSQFIKPLCQAMAQVCLCQKCQNYALKLRAARRFVKTLTMDPIKLVKDIPSAEELEKTLNNGVDTALPRTVDYEEWKMCSQDIIDKKQVSKITIDAK